MDAALKTFINDIPLSDTKKLSEGVKALIEHAQENYKKGGLDQQIDNTACRQLLDFVRQQREVVTNETSVNSSICPASINNVVLIDVRVKARGPDDYVFLHNKEIRERIARGNTILELVHKGQKKLIPILQGLTKFTGGLGDDDDLPVEGGTEMAWKSFFLQPIENAHSIVSMQKANGEAGHLACRWIENRFLIVCGSKNVHICFSKQSDLQSYTDQKYRLAVDISKALLNYLASLEDKGTALLSFLAWSRCTANFEFLQPTYQHVELLGDTPRLLFFALTRPHFDGVRESLCEYHPLVGLEIMRGLGLEIVNYEVLPFKCFDEHVAKIRQSFGKEGSVLYVLDSDTTNGKVLGLFKKKTIWYVIVRAIREKIKTALSRLVKNPDESLERISASCRARTQSRLKEIQRWLGFSDVALAQWGNLASRFIAWLLSEEHLIFDARAMRDQYRPRQRALHSSHQQRKADDAGHEEAEEATDVSQPIEDEGPLQTQFTLEDVRTIFPKVWVAFLADEHISDHVDYMR
eukprot:m.7588 g.7588  ORF g.7588 m.7588 type:complete len:522 (-) comp5254_c0_seq2:96-1661(-)